MNPATPRPDAHDQHDRLLVVRFATHDDDLSPSERQRAQSLLASCPDCGALASDVMTIAQATATAATPARPRDFRITPEQAATLRGPAWRRFLEWLAAPRHAVLRPLAGAAVAMGLVLVLVGGTIPGFSGGRGTPEAARPSQTDQGTVLGAASQAAASQAAVRAPVTDTGATDGAAPPPGGGVAAPGVAVSPGSAEVAGGSGKSGPDYATDATNLPAPAAGSLRPTGGRNASTAAPAAQATTRPTLADTPAPLAAATDEARTGDAAVAEPTPPPGDAGAPAEVSGTHGDSGWWVSLFGGLLLGVGLAVLLLTWLARRSTKDPLIP